jgi:predicted nucleotidyltransferase
MFGLPQNTIIEVQAIFTKYPSIEEVIIYGSRAKGDYKKGSDIDLTLKGSIANAELSNIIDELDESYIPYLFDVSIYNQLQSDSLKEHINSVGKVFYKKE